jgi:hypothetical protein
LRGRRATLDVSCGVFFANRIGRAGILWDALKIDGGLARNIDFEVANLKVPMKTRRKTSILKLQSVKIWGSLARNARFAAPMCLVSRRRRVYEGSCKTNRSFSKVSKQVFMSFCVAAVALCVFDTVACRKCQT